jgi:hypothetical protein
MPGIFPGQETPGAFPDPQVCGQIVHTPRVLGLTAAAPNIASYTVGPRDASFRISANIQIVASGTFNINATVIYTDETGTLRTTFLPFMRAAASVVSSLTQADGLSAWQGFAIHIRAKAGTLITVGTSNVFTSVTYNAEAVIERLT